MKPTRLFAIARRGGDARPEPKRPTPALLVGAVAILAAVAVAVVAALVSPNPDAAKSHPEPAANHKITAAAPAPSVSSSTVPVIPGTPSTAPGISAAAARTSIASFLTAVSAVRSTDADLTKQLAGVAVGAIVDEIANERQELTANGWKITGTPTVASVSVIGGDPSGHPPTATVEACIDSSKVVTLDSDGKSLGPNSLDRALNLYTLRLDPVGWRVVSRTFPNDPNC